MELLQAKLKGLGINAKILRYIGNGYYDLEVPLANETFLAAFDESTPIWNALDREGMATLRGGLVHLLDDRYVFSVRVRFGPYAS